MSLDFSESPVFVISDDTLTIDWSACENTHRVMWYILRVLASAYDFEMKRIDK